MKKLTFLFLLIPAFIVKSYAVDPVLFKPQSMLDPMSCTVTIKNVGQGNCALIHNHADNHYLVIDVGSLSNKPKNTEEHIEEEFGFSEINNDIPLSANTITVIVSHSDKDHINLFKSTFGLNIELLSRVERVILGDHFSNYFRLNDKGEPVEETRAFLRDFVLKVPHYEDKLFSLSHGKVGKLDLHGLLGTPVVEPDSFAGYLEFVPRQPIDGFFKSGQTGILEVLGSNAGDSPGKIKDTNANSAVVRININGKNILVMGDATGHTTTRILESIDDPKALEADLLIASHHGAESEDTNHITWAAITKAKRVALSSGFNAGYGHPTLAAVANYLVTGLESDQVYSDPLCGLGALQKDRHELAIYNSIGPHIERLPPYVRGLEWIGLKEGQNKWAVFQTEKPIYATGSSGELRYTFSHNGKFIHFWKEH